jgi:hypothetical protein
MALRTALTKARVGILKFENAADFIYFSI